MRATALNLGNFGMLLLQQGIPDATCNLEGKRGGLQGERWGFDDELIFSLAYSTLPPMARIHTMKKTTLELIVDEAVRFIKAHEPPEGYFVAFSGGKDSIVSLELVRMAGVKHEAFYSVSGIDPPEVVKFIREHYPQVTFLYPQITFWQGIRKKFPPLRTKRWCCDYLRKYPSRSVPLKHRIMGMRIEESSSRAERPRIEHNRTEKTTVYKPIFLWKEWSVWEFIDRRSLPYPSLYDEGWDRVGCTICPFICSPNMKLIERNRNRWPGMYRTFEHAVREWFDARKAQGVRFREETAEEYLKHWYQGIA